MPLPVWLAVSTTRLGRRLRRVRFNQDAPASFYPLISLLPQFETLSSEMFLWVQYPFRVWDSPCPPRTMGFKRDLSRP